MSTQSGKDGMALRGNLALISLVGMAGGVMGMLLDRKDPLRGFLVGAVTGASFAGMVSARKGHERELPDYYSEGQPLYKEHETEAGV